MKKIIVGILSFAILFVISNSLSASSVWNGASNDCPTVAVANYTTNTGYVNPCWPLTTVNANPGDSVNVRIYYHNTGTQNNTNTRVILNAPTGTSTSHAFTGQIVSDQGSISFGPVRINTTSGSTLTWGGTHWLPNQTQSDASLLYGQSGAEILSGGLKIGTIAPSWSSQGSVVVAFSVVGGGTPPVNVPTGTLTPANNSCKISLNKSSCEINFSWNTQNPVGTSAITRDGGSTVATGNYGSKALVIPHGSATFRLYNNALQLDSKTVSSSCTSGTSWDGAKCAENVNPAYNCSVTNFTVGGALSTTVSSGSGVDLAWTTSNCNYVNITNVGNNLPSNNNQTVYPTTSTTYRITGYGSSDVSQSRTVSVTVTPNTNPAYSCVISDFKANGDLFTTVESGDYVNLSWSTENCYDISISPNVGTGLNLNSNHTVYPTNTTTYRLTARGTSGSSVYRTVKVTVTPKIEEKYYCSISSFSADDSYVSYGEDTRLRWETDNCYSVSISNVGTVSSSGSRSVSPSRTTNYTLTAYGSNGVKQTRALYIVVGPANYIPPTYNICSINSFVANPNYVNQGAPVTLSWNTSNCHSVNISGVGNVSSSGSRIVYPSGTTNYLLTAYGQSGQSIARSASVVVSAPLPPVLPPVYNKCAVTTIATNISQNQATLNGLISSSSFTNAYFEYGTTVNLGQRTPTRSYAGNTSFSETISGLLPNTIYYFRFVADCQGGLSQGSLEVFRTISSQVVRPIIVQGTTVVGSSSPIMLKIENRYESIGRGDIIDYTVTYKNIGKSTLLDPILQVIAPKGIVFINASKGTYSEDTRTLTVKLDNLRAGEEGIIYVQGRVNSIVDNTAQIVTTALLVYTNTNGAQENAIAYVLNVPKGFYNNSLGAAAFFGGLYGMNLIWLLLIIILLLIIVLLARRYFFTPSVISVHHSDKK